MPIFEVTDPKTGKTVELESQDSTPPTEAELEQVFSSLGNSGPSLFTESSDAPTDQQQDFKQTVQKQNILGAIFNVPGATSRAAIQAEPGLALTGPLAGLVALSGLAGPKAQQAAGQGAANPDSVSTFQEEALKVASPKTQSVAANFAGGLPASIGGLAADMIVDPTTVLTTLLTGMRPGKVKPIGDIVDKNFTQAVPPSTRGVKAHRAIENTRDSARSAVESIVDNKQGLQYTDDLGEVIKGQLPQNMDQFSQAISQTKKKLFAEYNGMLKAAGEQGQTVALKPIATEIENAVASVHIKDISPSVANYGSRLAQRLKARGTYSLEEAQDVIEGLNNKIKAYFVNPTPQAIQEAVIDRAVVNHLRKSLIEAVEAKKGPNYEILRRQYGHLSAIEEQVTKGAVKAMGSRGSGLGKLFDVYSTGDIISGIVSMNPHQVAKGAFQIGARNGVAYWMSPNRAVKNMFNGVDKLKNIDPKKRQMQRVLRQLIATASVASAKNLAATGAPQPGQEFGNQPNSQ